MKPFKQVINEIKKLPWNKYDPKKIVYLSYHLEIEFAETLICILNTYPEYQCINIIADQEISAKNLQYEDYTPVGGHSNFLEYFCVKSNVYEEEFSCEFCNRFHFANTNYLNVVREFGISNLRAMTIISRVREMKEIFSILILAHDWEGLDLGFFKYYLSRHIELYSGECVFLDLTKEFQIDENLIMNFYCELLKFCKVLGTE